MKYDFTSIIDRQGKDAIAVDSPPGKPKEGFDLIPMWVADMNFATAPSIVQAISDRLAHPLFGYFEPRPEYYDAIINWQKVRNGVEGLLPEHIGYANGVLGGVVAAVNVMASRGDNILIHAPTYTGFTGVLTGNGYHLIHSQLVQDEQGIYRMDFEDMENKIVQHNIHCTVFCNPHNPCGRVWEAWEIEKAMELFKKYDVYVVSDEIWSDLILPGYKHTPTQSVSEDARMRTVAMYAPSKTFSLAGLVGSYQIIYNKWLRDRVNKEAGLSHYNNMNVLSMYALMGAYQPEGQQWLDELCQVLGENVDYACDYIHQHFEGVEVSKPQGTYMLWLDCTKWCASHGKSIADVIQTCYDVGVAISDGRGFHGPFHMRLNLALPMSRLREAMDRLDKYVFNP